MNSSNNPSTPKYKTSRELVMRDSEMISIWSKAEQNFNAFFERNNIKSHEEFIALLDKQIAYEQNKAQQENKTPSNTRESEASETESSPTASRHI